MTYNTGTATDYIDLLDQLVEVATSRHMSAVVVNAGGINHVVGEILDISNTGATRTHDAQIEVTAVAAGVVTAARVYRGGAYTVDPTTTTANASTSTGFTFDGTATTPGTGATFDLTFAATGWTQLTREQVAASAVVADGGTGYTNGSTDVLTVVGGVVTSGGSPATFTATVVGGIVTSAALLTAGEYEVAPTNPVLTSVAPAGGTGCTLTLTMADKTGDTTVVLQGDAGAALDPLVAIKTYSSELDETGINTVYNWACFGMSAWSDQFRLDGQSNISPGLAAGGGITTNAGGDGAFVPLKDADAFNIDWTLSITGRRIIMVARVEGASTVHYPQMHLGLLSPFGITSEFDYPIYIAGSSDRKKAWYRDTSSIFGGLSEAISRSNGPAFYFSPEAAWLAAKSSRIISNTSTTPTANAANIVPRVNVWPLCHTLRSDEDADRTWTNAPTAGWDSDDLTLATNAIAIYRTPDSGGDLFPLYPVTVKQDAPADPKLRTFGEMDGVFWFHQADTTASSEDRQEQGADKYTLFQNGTRIEPYSFLALRED